ncbi:MAG: helix-turn-helix domain-containing protein [Firmicutes bacterium]|jgi:transcriptional regulator with XRE-family HTH domain|nr:helix-turn-helix domain-containing protein [Bacillota bacterium]
MTEKERFREIDRREMGRRIKNRRETVKMSREKLAEHLDVSPQFIADIEYGSKGVSIKSLYLLSQALGVTTDYILAGSVYELDGDSEAARVQEQILDLLHRCDAKQLKGIRDIAEIYVDGVKEE